MMNYKGLGEKISVPFIIKIIGLKELIEVKYEAIVLFICIKIPWRTNEG